MTAYRTLGRTGVKVSPLTLGAMNFGARGNPDHEDGIKIIHLALDTGINVIDTADVYSQGESEEIVGKALAGGRRDDVFLATKFHGRMGDNPLHEGNSRRWIFRAVENSLRRLNTDHIDLYQAHRPDEATDFEETIGALTDLVHQGKIRYFGTSVHSPAQILEGQWIAERRGFSRPVSEQIPYSPLVRSGEREVLPLAQRYGLGVLAYGPLAAGWLSGRYRVGARQPESYRKDWIPGRYDIAAPHNADKLAAADALARLAEEAGLPLIHLSVAFALNHPAVSSVIVGPRTREHLDTYLGALDVRLTADVLDRIDEIVAPGHVFHLRDTGAVPPAVADPARRRRPPRP
ncbi:aldo/keto reductase [Streptomyces rugosispiralis]|uniref:Aldo/keto reductase n=1 Tax=Streptomyces rugosispiralis TaxID=2967341 RepID=A0ABT1URC5_9ACTN|nr:aldo/keto reductase [Streptomyces rugosispiralis]MCQ8187612.1 aldo/keto reductase [Streptomyces rugosispiralis]